MKTRITIFVIFLVAALYDGLLGLAFLFAAAPLFDWFEVTPPNHFGYVHFSAALLIVFALMFLAVAVAPRRNRNLIPYGILLKVSYCSVVLYHWLMAGIPMMWKPFFFCDLAFIFLFASTWWALGKKER